ncbi:MAG: OmpA family protein [Bryobacteraceae bacterium]|nr:OmpA family protein [Bryobacteraceae bacterium]
MTGFDARRSTVAFGAAALILIGTGCATRKHVRGVVGPVEARVSQTERRNTEQQASIGELNNSVSRADERAQEAGQAANAADQRARAAGDAAQMARNRADEGFSLAEGTRARLGEFSENIDNYKMVTAQNILFAVGKSNLTKDSMQTLDEAVGQLQSTKNFIMEVQGFTDNTGSATANLELSRKRADAVVRYLTSKHTIPLRRISMLGLGEDDPNADNKSRDGRKQARRVEVRVFSRDLGSQNAGSSLNIPRTTGSAARTEESQQPPTSGQTATPQQP